MQDQATTSSRRWARGRSYLKRLMRSRLPILQWLPSYNRDKALCDMIAGVTVGLTVMPQGLAYATLAGLEPQYGLYSAFIGAMIYVVFGSCKDITIGPTALMSLMTYQYVQNRGPDFAVLLAFLAGLMQLLMAALRLGVLVDFISIPVTVGFTSATSVIIVASQLKGLLGLRISPQGFLDTVAQVANNIHKTSYWDAGMSLSCIVALLLFRRMKDVKLWAAADKATPRQRSLAKLLWLVSTARNAIVVVVCSSIAYQVQRVWSYSPFVLTGPVKHGLPRFSLPPFSTTVGNRTLDFMEMCQELGPSIVLVPIIGVLGNVAIAKAFASGNQVDATQELVTLGVCNVVGSLASSMPVTGSFSRSAVNHASGVKTPMGGLYTGLLILLALTLLTPYFYFIPKASLAAVIICAVVYMIEYEVVKLMWRSSRKDLVPTFATFVLCLVIGVEYGIVAGVAINLVFLLYPSARPQVNVEKQITSSGAEYLMVTPSNSLYFPAVDFIKQSVGNAGITEGSSQIPVVVDCRYMLGADFTAAKGIAALIMEFNSRKQGLYFYNPRCDVVAVLRGACGDDFQYVSTSDELAHLLHSATDRGSSHQLLEIEREIVDDRLASNGRNDYSVNQELKEVKTNLLQIGAS
ncbi:sodium-independent sulfate anion transporter [Trichogramma pretiosum]|uniref:sodium-independent sulfate anion transporter n=1 Tax=Trichogramma pretiosum TaxID=7493 RepID=UPI0006C9E225|nr:sodium-independent sulfate anion transporter [Trichogramma pretiosum]XP_014233002.1 sodium-independent sulfate anion transporter [Trichogramma pretiosum]XP_014233003.1 sodium-independent sulfate anion transporter [Trichogramma pretiosum]XP_014233004.1 sodium-independent sulfate anion transporter [Trichogramma pretiosum]